MIIIEDCIECMPITDDVVAHNKGRRRKFLYQAGAKSKSKTMRNNGF